MDTDNEKQNTDNSNLFLTKLSSKIWTLSRNIEYSGLYTEHSEDIAITCAAAPKICICVTKNLGNCTESLNSTQKCTGNLFPARTEHYSLVARALMRGGGVVYSYVHVMPD